MWSLELITAPTAAALDRETEVKQQLRLEPSEIVAQHTVIDGYISAARYNCETYTDRQLITATWELWLDTWFEEGIYRCEPGTVESLILPKPPLASITSITYVAATDGTVTTWSSSDYVLRANAGPQAQKARVFPAYGAAWPSHRSQPAAIKIRFVAGYGATFASVPDGLRTGMLLDVQASYDGDQDGKLRETARVMWSPFRAF